MWLRKVTDVIIDTEPVCEEYLYLGGSEGMSPSLLRINCDLVVVLSKIV